MKVSKNVKRAAAKVAQPLVKKAKTELGKAVKSWAARAATSTKAAKPIREGGFGAEAISSKQGKKLEGDTAFVTELYRSMLGREPDAAGLASHLNGLKNGMHRDEIVDVFRRSPEFQALQARGPQPAPVADDAAGGVDGVSGTRGGTKFGGVPTFTGFDAGKLAAPLVRSDGVAKSAKYTFAKLAQASGTMPQTKGDAEKWFNEYIKPGLEKEGFGVDWVKGDKAWIRTRENPAGGPVDFLRGADSRDPNYIAFAWQPEDGGVGAPSGAGGGGGAPVGDVVGSGAVGGSGLADRDFVMSILSQYPATNDGIVRAVNELRKHRGYEHVTILQHHLRLDKLDFGRGAIVDVVVGSGGPNPSWGWMPE